MNKENVCPETTVEPIPLLDFLCSKLHCNINELQLLLMNVPVRRRIVNELRRCKLVTNHLHSTDRNFSIRCDDITCRPASCLFAMNGYLNITVRQYYYVKHARKLRKPFLPCIIEYGGGRHRSFYPLEIIQICPI